MSLLLKRTLLCLALLSSASGIVAAQDYKIRETHLANSRRAFRVEVTFTDLVATAAITDLDKSDVQVVAMPSGRTLKPDAPSLQGNDMVVVGLDPAVPPAATDTDYTVCFARLRFIDSNNAANPLIQRSNVCGSGKIEDQAATQARLLNLFKEVNSVPKATEERNIFASGFVTQGAGGDSEGGMDLNLNSADLGVPGLTATLHMKKATANNADPKHFDVGLKYSSTLLFHRRALDRIREAQDSGNTAAAQRELDSLRRAVWSGVTFDFGSSFEAQAFSFDVTNFIGEGLIRIKSRVLPLRRPAEGGAAGDRAAFYKFFLVPGGVEVGQNLNNGMNQTMGAAQAAAAASDPNSPSSVDWIARYKCGAGLTLFFRDLKSRFLFKRIEFDAQFVGRYLFRKEVMFDQSTMMNIATTKGMKPWSQVDLRAYVADTPAGRFGLRLNYNKGSLPPVFSPTNSFQFGFVYETADDNKSR